MRAEGVMPNLVTFNTLIDVYGKTGQWEEAVRVLDTLEQQVRPDGERSTARMIANPLIVLIAVRGAYIR